MGHFWDGKPRLHIKYKVGDLIKNPGHCLGDPDWYGVVTKIDPWFMREKAGCQAETYAIEVMWHFIMRVERHDISFNNDPYEIVGKAEGEIKCCN
tara:strand:+ start:124 stop:408 length:285 start_codon:yes stop_codon:yes gene_type:complete